MASVLMSNGCYFQVDEADLPFVSYYSWCLTAGYPSRRKTLGTGVSEIVYLHHELMGKPPTGLQTDHKNRDKLDNRRHNLRFVTPQVNVLNRNVVAKGVSFDNTHGKWKAYFDIIAIGKPKRRVNMGTFATRAEAIIAREKYIAQNRRPS